jgi:hypothetical protein
MGYYIKVQNRPCIGDFIYHKGKRWQVVMVMPDAEFDLRIRRINRAGEMVVESIKSIWLERR